MPYELRIAGKPSVTFDTEPQATAAAARALHDDPNAEPEIIDQTTGAPASPAADTPSREDLTNKIGF